MAAQDMFATVSDHVFPFLREVGSDNSTYAKQMQGARFTIPTPALLAKVMEPARSNSYARSRHKGRLV